MCLMCDATEQEAGPQRTGTSVEANWIFPRETPVNGGPDVVDCQRAVEVGSFRSPPA
jgi:hypothetical protein